MPQSGGISFHSWPESSGVLSEWRTSGSRYWGKMLSYITLAIVEVVRSLVVHAMT